MSHPRLARWSSVLLVTTALTTLPVLSARADEATLWDTVKVRTQQLVAFGGDTAHALYAWATGLGSGSRLADDLLGFSSKNLRDLELLADSAGYRLEDITIHRGAAAPEVSLDFVWQHPVDVHHKADLRDIIASDNGLVDEDTRAVVGTLLDAGQRAQTVPDERFQTRHVSIRLGHIPDLAFDFRTGDEEAAPHSAGIAGLMPTLVSSAAADEPGRLHLASSDIEEDPEPPAAIVEKQAEPVKAPPPATPAPTPAPVPEKKAEPAAPPAAAAPAPTPVPVPEKTAEPAAPPAAAAPAPTPVPAPEKAEPAAPPAAAPAPAPATPAEPAPAAKPAPGKSSALPAPFQVADATMPEAAPTVAPAPAPEPMKAEAPKAAAPAAAPAPAPEPMKAEAPKAAAPAAVPAPAPEPMKAEAPKPMAPAAVPAPAPEPMKAEAPKAAASYRVTLGHTNGRAAPSKEAAKLRALSPKDVLVKTGRSQGNWYEFVVNGESGPTARVWVHQSVFVESK